MTDLIAIEPGVGALPALPEPVQDEVRDEDKRKGRNNDEKTRALVDPLVSALEPIAHAQTAKESSESNGLRVVVSESASASKNIPTGSNCWQELSISMLLLWR